MCVFSFLFFFFLVGAIEVQEKTLRLTLLKQGSVTVNVAVTVTSPPLASMGPFILLLPSAGVAVVRAFIADTAHLASR